MDGGPPLTYLISHTFPHLIHLDTQPAWSCGSHTSGLGRRCDGLHRHCGCIVAPAAPPLPL